MLWVVFVVPILITSIACLTVFFDVNINVENPWRFYVIFNFNIYLHVIIVLMVLFMSHLNYLEHKNDTWKNLYVMPVPKWVPFFSKFFYGYLVVGMSVLVFYLLIMLSGLLLSHLRTELGFQHTSYWLKTLIPTIKVFLGSTAIMTIMYWVSHYIKSLVTCVIIGLAGYASAFALFIFEYNSNGGEVYYSLYHPFNFTSYGFDSFIKANDHLLHIEQVYYGLIGGMFLLIIHYLLSLKKKNV